MTLIPNFIHSSLFRLPNKKYSIFSTFSSLLVYISTIPGLSHDCAQSFMFVASADSWLWGVSHEWTDIAHSQTRCLIIIIQCPKFEPYQLLSLSSASHPDTQTDGTPRLTPNFLKLVQRDPRPWRHNSV